MSRKEFRLEEVSPVAHRPATCATDIQRRGFAATSSTQSPYPASTASLVNRSRGSVFAWATSIRSNGSTCTAGSLATAAAYSPVIGTSQPAVRARTRLIEWKTVAEVPVTGLFFDNAGSAEARHASRNGGGLTLNPRLSGVWAWKRQLSVPNSEPTPRRVESDFLSDLS